MRLTAEIIAVLVLAMFQTNCGDATNDSETPADSGSVSYPSGYSQTADSTATLSFQGATGASALALAPQIIDVLSPAGTAVGGLELTTAKIVLDKIKIKMEAGSTVALTDDGAEDESLENGESEESDDASELEFEFAGPFIVDLLANTVTPDPGELMLPAGNYKEIVLSMHKIEDADAEILQMDNTDPLFGKSFLVEGTFTPAVGSAVAVNMSYEFGEEFKLRGSKGMDVTSAAVNNMVIAFRLAHWFKFDNAETNPDAVDFSSLASADITISEDSDDAAKAIRDVIKENLKVSADFGKDEDGDGELSNEEDSEDESEEDDVEVEMVDSAL